MGIVIILFVMEGCDHCQEMTPVVKRVAGRHPEVPFHIVDVDKNPQAADLYRVPATPALVRAYRRGYHRITGVTEETVIEEFFAGR